MKVALNKGRPCSIACTPRSAASDRLRPIPTRSSIISPLRHSPDEPLPCCLNHRQLLATSAGSRGAILCANMLCHSELDDTPFVASPLRTAQSVPKSGLKLAREIPLPGPANRFDYQSLDPATGRIYMNHMNAGRTIVFDANSNKVITEIMDLPRATGGWAVASHHQVYVSAAGAHEVAIIDDRTLKVTSRVGGIQFPDGIAYASGADKVFVSDESGGTDVVIDPNTSKKRSTIELGGEAGNTHYDSVSHCILVAVQTKDQLVAIDPVSERIVRRYDLPGSDHPHGFTLDEDGRLAFISCEGNGALLVVCLLYTSDAADE